MKKFVSLMLALLLALTCVVASAETVYTKVTLDAEQAKTLLQNFGTPEDQLGMVDTIAAVVNALGVNVVTADGAVEVDLDLSGNQAVALAFAMGEEGATVVSNLFPNYAVTISQETISQMMEQMAANIPGGSGEGGFDMAAMAEVFGGYISRWVEACASAGQAGEPVSGTYEFDGHTFDTMIPVTVDMPAIAEATRTLVDEMLADEAVVSMLQGVAQGSGKELGVDEIKAGLDEWMAHFPDTVNAEVYANSDGSEAFYMIANSYYEGSEDPFFSCYMNFESSEKMDMGYNMTMVDDETGENATMEAGFAMDGSIMSMYVDVAGMYMGLTLSIADNAVDCDLYFMNDQSPLLNVNVAISEGGALSLTPDAAGKTVLAIEEVMADGNSEAAQGLYNDVMANGLGALMGAISAVPELSGLMSMLAA